MSGPSFTPGPWLLKHGVVENRNVRWIELTDYRLVAKLPDTLTHPDSLWDEARVSANARLIAASPELYSDADFLAARVRELEGALIDDSEAARDYFGHVIPALARMESALAKARGEAE